ncbi:MAG: gliding motility-associated C-terminal domain-containing protein, partial [Bacteroidota bacterium]
YRYRLTAENSCGDALETEWHQLVQLSGTNNDGAGPIQLSWTAYEGWPVDRYEIWRQTERGEWTLLETVPGGQLDYVREDILAGLIHRYQIRAWQADGTYHSWSNRIELRFAHPITVSNVFTPNGDGINETFFIRNLELYPDHQLDVYDRWGRRVYTAAPYQNNWDGEGLKAGTYYYSFRVQSTEIDEIPEAKIGWVTVLR